jgi:hypothetical protein
MESLGPLLDAARVFWASPECRRWVSIVAFLCSVNAGFWLLAKVMGAVLELFSELFFEELWDALATLYNIALAVFFAAVLFAAAVKGAPASQLYWRQACGLILLYVALGAAYTDPAAGEIDEHARPGWATGLVAYLFFAVVPSLTAQPAIYQLIDLLKAVSDSWVGKVSTILVAGGVALSVARRGLRAMFARLSPFLWFIGALEHPPIRVRKP